jgi:hypothetical protein
MEENLAFINHSILSFKEINYIIEADEEEGKKLFKMEKDKPVQYREPKWLPGISIPVETGQTFTDAEKIFISKPENKKYKDKYEAEVKRREESKASKVELVFPWEPVKTTHKVLPADVDKTTQIYIDKYPNQYAEWEKKNKGSKMAGKKPTEIVKPESKKEEPEPEEKQEIETQPTEETTKTEEQPKEPRTIEKPIKPKKKEEPDYGNVVFYVHTTRKKWQTDWKKDPEQGRAAVAFKTLEDAKKISDYAEVGRSSSQNVLGDANKAYDTANKAYADARKRRDEIMADKNSKRSDMNAAQDEFMNSYEVMLKAKRKMSRAKKIHSRISEAGDDIVIKVKYVGTDAIIAYSINPINFNWVDLKYASPAMKRDAFKNYNAFIIDVFKYRKKFRVSVVYGY